MTKDVVQALFAPFNENGSWMELRQENSEPIKFGLIDSWTVTRVDGNEFWLMFHEIGYQLEWQYTHTIKVVNWRQDDSYMLELIDDRERTFYTEMLVEGTKRDLHTAWAEWQHEKSQQPAVFANAHDSLLATHTEFAARWPK